MPKDLSYLSLFNDDGSLKHVPADANEAVQTVFMMFKKSKIDLPDLAIAAYIDHLQSKHSDLMTPDVIEQIKVHQAAKFRLPTNHKIFKPRCNFYSDQYGEYTYQVLDTKITQEAAWNGNLRNPGNPAYRRSILTSILDLDKETDIQVLDIADLNEYLHNIKEDQRYQIIVDNNGHFSAVDIQVQNGKKQCVILDAANDSRMDSINQVMEFNQFDKIYMPLARTNDRGVPQTLQRDGESCPFFALLHAKELAKLPDIYEHLEQYTESDQNVYLDRLPPELVCTAQSLSFLESYQNENPELVKKKMSNGETLSSYLEQHTETAQDGKKQNRSIMHFRDQAIADLRKANPEYQEERKKLIDLKADIKDMTSFDERAADPKIKMNDLIREMKQKNDSLVSTRMDEFKQKFSEAMANMKGLAFGTNDNNFHTFLNQTQNEFKLLEDGKNIAQIDEYMGKLEKTLQSLTSGVNHTARNYIDQQRKENRWYTVGKEKNARAVEERMSELTVEQRLRLEVKSMRASASPQKEDIISELNKVRHENHDDEWVIVNNKTN